MCRDLFHPEASRQRELGLVQELGTVEHSCPQLTYGDLTCSGVEAAASRTGTAVTVLAAVLCHCDASVAAIVAMEKAREIAAATVKRPQFAKIRHFQRSAPGDCTRI